MHHQQENHNSLSDLESVRINSKKFIEVQPNSNNKNSNTNLSNAVNENDLKDKVTSQLQLTKKESEDALNVDKLNEIS